MGENVWYTYIGVFNNNTWKVYKLLPRQQNSNDSCFACIDLMHTLWGINLFLNMKV